MAKDLKYYLELKYARSMRSVVTGNGEDFFLAEIVDLPGCVVGASERNDAITLLEKARMAYITSRYEKSLDIPPPSDGQWTSHDPHVPAATRNPRWDEVDLPTCTEATEDFAPLEVDADVTDRTYTEDRLIAVGW